MYKVFFYDNGKESIPEYLSILRRQSITSCSSKADLIAIIAFIDTLAEKGTEICELVTERPDGSIWELRPLKNRIFYAFVKDDTIILLHHFIKRSEHMPQRELKQAMLNLNNLTKRTASNDY